ncbi:MAG TPA: hypothetical protein VJA18_00270 [Candidatus Nanoarchaeia archaeon]|nr:hypothetical protein [Candidatus Nanoarchaeia archaeon]
MVEYEIQTPKYVTPEILKGIENLMVEGQMHPRCPVGDMTVEVAAGVEPRDAVDEMIKRTSRDETTSIYQKLFPQTRG